MKYLFALFALLHLSGCNTDDAHKATLMPGAKPAIRYRAHPQAPNPTDEQIRLLKAQTDAKARLAEIEARKAEKLKQLEAQRTMTVAQYEAQKAQKIKALELEQTRNTNAAQTQIAKTKAQTKLAIEKERQSTAIAHQKEQIAFYRQLTVVVSILMVLLMGLIYLLYRHRQTLKLKLHEEELRHQAYLEASRRHHEQVTKILDILTNDNTDKALRKELTKLLGTQNNYDTALLENKK
jgi:glutamate/tyrosine decarboxylase-like PLP-dependent enzyme